MGVTSDDGVVLGQLTLSGSVNRLLVADRSSGCWAQTPTSRSLGCESTRAGSAGRRGRGNSTIGRLGGVLAVVLLASVAAPVAASVADLVSDHRALT